MNVIKRDGTSETVQFDKVLERIRKAAAGLDPAVNYTRLAQLVLAEIHDGVRTTDLDELAARMAVSYMTVHPDWGTLAAQIIVSNCQRSAPTTFSAAMEELATLVDANGRPVPAIASDVAEFVRANAAALDAMVRPENDFLLDYFGFKTLEKAYLMRGRGRRTIETPQYMWLRVAVGMWGSSHDLAHVNEGGTNIPLSDRLTNIRETYELMSTKAFTHATPTLFNSGTPRPQMSSCYLQAMKSDSIEGIFDTLKDCAQISKYAGGIGLHIHNIRAQGTPIAGTQGTSNGIVPMLRVFNNTARYVDQCFPADTLIYTSYGNKRIADIQPGDHVFTSGGSETVDETGKHFVKGPRGPGFDTVRKLVTHTYSGEMYHLTFSSGTTVTVTPQHPFLIKQSSGEWDYVEAEKLYVGAETNGFTVTNITSSTVTDATLYDLEVDGTHDYTVQGAGIVHNGGGRRNGSFAIYLEPWHADIQAFLKMKSNTGSEEERARDLFYALWIPDLFMRRVETGGDWSLFCPHEAPGLADVHGAEFEALYTRYEAERKAKRTIPAQKLWSDILVSQIETGTPYLLYKDAANAKSNQKNLGTIKSSNLCVAPETPIDIYATADFSTKQTVPISSVVDTPVIVWNGTDYTTVVPRKTGEGQRLVDVIIRHSQRDSKIHYIRSLKCTEYHKFILPTTVDGLSDAERVDAKDLQPGMRLCDFTTADGKIVEQHVAFVNPMDRISDTYCYTEPENHVGIFNGIMTGQCTEIIEFSSPDETAVCNLASIALPYFVDKATQTFDFDRLRAVTKVIVRNLNRVIDINYYPTPETRLSNMRHRPVGLGVQGLADVFAMLGLAWETPEAAALNQTIFEHIYYAALERSAELAVIDGPYSSFAGSPSSQGILQPDLWGLDPATYKTATTLDWQTLRTQIQATGLRNSLLVAPMPTASTSQILGYNECIEPFTSNIYVRRTLAGEFTVVNRHLVADLLAAGLWSEELKNHIVAANGSVQGLPTVPADIKARYKTVWEIKQKTLIDMAADRGAFICQSQSLNLFVQDPTIAKLSSMHFYGWKKGLKTGIYYLRTKSAVQAIKFTVDPSLLKRDQLTQQLVGVDPNLVAAQKVATNTNNGEPAECLLCSS